MTKTLKLSLCLVIAMLCAAPATAGLNISASVLWQPDPEDDAQVFLHVSNTAYPIPRERAVAVSEFCPTLKVLYMSGFADHAIVHDGILEPGLAFLPTPLTVETLTRTVRTVLDGT